MRVKTAVTGLVVSAVVLGGGYAGLQLASGPLGRTSSSATMAKPRKFKLPDDPDRAVVVLQLCWYPDGQAQIDAGYSLGAQGTSFDRVGAPLTCQTPWTRKAVLDRGQRAALGWTVVRGPISKIKYRITVNNRPRIDDEATANTRMYACIIGTPPCEIP